MLCGALVSVEHDRRDKWTSLRDTRLSIGRLQMLQTHPPETADLFVQVHAEC